MCDEEDLCVMNNILLSKWRFCLTDFCQQVSKYVTEGLQRANEALKEAASLRERFGYNTANSRKVAQAMAVAVRSFLHHY